MSIAELNVELRNETGKQKAKAIRREGRIPGIYYISDAEPINVSFDAMEMNRLVSREFTVLNVKMDGKDYKCVIREIQRDPVTEEILHVDFLGIKLDQKVSLTIPIVLKGTPAGVREGGILEHLLRDVEVEGLPLEIPEHIELDVTDMNIGSTIYLADIAVDKIEFVTDVKQPVAHVQVSRAAVSAGGEEGEEEEGEEEE